VIDRLAVGIAYAGDRPVRLGWALRWCAGIGRGKKDRYITIDTTTPTRPVSSERSALRQHLRERTGPGGVDGGNLRRMSKRAQPDPITDFRAMIGGGAFTSVLAAIGNHHAR
jgi:hypothetical protein